MSRVVCKGVPAAVLAALILSGCIPLLPRPDIASRTNLPDGVPGFIRIGESTRADVVHALGQPEACAVNESWMMYASARSKGGVLLTADGMAGGTVERMRYARLILQFDAAGMVTNTFTETASCWVSQSSSGEVRDFAPCIDLSGRDVPGKYQLAPIRE